MLHDGPTKKKSNFCFKSSPIKESSVLFRFLNLTSKKANFCNISSFNISISFSDVGPNCDVTAGVVVSSISSLFNPSNKDALFLSSGTLRGVVYFVMVECDLTELSSVR